MTILFRFHAPGMINLEIDLDFVPAIGHLVRLDSLHWFRVSAVSHEISSIGPRFYDRTIVTCDPE